MDAEAHERDVADLVNSHAAHTSSLLLRITCLEAENARLREDKERMDYLEDEAYREQCWVDAGCPSGGPLSLFRINNPITRAAIDKAREALRGR